jgi:uncharacterized protein (TIGR02453 family)
MPMADDLNKIRQEIDYSFDEFKNIIQQRAFKNTFDTLDNKEILIRPPKGYEKDNPALEYLKLKNFIVMAGIEENELLEKDLIPKVISHFKIMKPLVDFLNRAIDS